MNSLIVYDSEFGNTERVAQAMAEALESFGSAKIATVRQGTPSITGIDLLIAGCPTWNLRPSDPMMQFVRSLPRKALAGVSIASFDTEYRRTSRLFHASAARAVAGRLRRAGGKLITPATRFFVADRQGPLEDGEVEQANRWAHGIGVELTNHPD